MKMNSKKIIVSTLALVMGAALAGSISGTVAWYQYSTRAQAEFQGVSAHCSEDLQIRIVSADAGLGAWHNGNLDYTDVANYLKSADGANRGATTYADLRPVHTEALDPTGAEGSIVARTANLKKSPRVSYTNPDNWSAASAATDFVDLPLQLRVKDVNGEETGFLAKDIYITDVTIERAGAYDISDAVRVGVMVKEGAQPTAEDGSEDYATFAKSADAVEHFGALDLDKEDGLDKTGYTFQKQETYLYGAPAAHASYLELADGYLRDGTTLYSLSGATLTAVSPAPTVYANIAARDAAAAAENDLCYVTSEAEFFKCTAAGTPGTWAALSYQEAPVGGYAKISDKFYTYSAGTLTEVTDLPSAVATDLTPVTADEIGIASFDADGELEHGVEIGSTTETSAANDANDVFVTLRIYLDGWQKISGDAVWNTNLIGAQFNVGISFETTLHDDAAE